jgi:hypothetical protein
MAGLVPAIGVLTCTHAPTEESTRRAARHGTPSIAMADKSFERIVLSRARSAAFDGQQTLDKTILSKHTAAIAIDGFL